MFLEQISTKIFAFLFHSVRKAQSRKPVCVYIYLTDNRFEVEIPITWKSLGSMDTDNSVMRKFDKIPLI